MVGYSFLLFWHSLSTFYIPFLYSLLYTPSLHSLSILFTLYSFPLPPLYSPFLHPLYTLSLTHLYPLPTFPQMTSPPLILPLYPFLHSFLNPSLPSTYISSYDYSPFDTPTLCSMFPFYPLYLFAYHKKLLWLCSPIAIGLPTGHTRTRPYK